MAMTMVEKVLARTSEGDSVKIGDILECQVDQVVQLDISFALTEMIPVKIKDP